MNLETIIYLYTTRYPFSFAFFDIFLKNISGQLKRRHIVL